MRKLIGIALIVLILGQSALAGNNIKLPTDLEVHFSAQPDEGVAPGDLIEFEITVVNNGPQPLTQAVALVSSEFFSQIDINEGSQDCTLVLAVGNDIDPVPSSTGDSSAASKGGEPFFIYFWFPLDDGGPIEVGESRTCNFARPSTSLMPPVWSFSFGLLGSSIVDLDPTNDTSTVILRRGTLPTTLLALSPVALLILLAGMMLFASLILQRRHSRRH